MKKLLLIAVCAAAMASLAGTLHVYDDLYLHGDLDGVDMAAPTNSVLSMTRVAAWTATSVTAGSNYLGELPSYAGAKMPIVSTGMEPIMWQVLWTTDGNTWNTGQTNGPVVAALIVAGSGYITNAVVYAFDSPERYGRTNDLRYQTLYVDRPDESSEAANKDYTDRTAAGVVGGWSVWPATNTLHLSGQRQAFDDCWDLLSDTNDPAVTAVNLRFLGQGIIRSQAGALADGYITNLTVTESNVTLRVLTNGVSAALSPEYTLDLGAQRAHWLAVTNFTSSYPFSTNGEFTIQFDRPATNAFIRVRPVGTKRVTIDADLSVTGAVRLAATNAAPSSPSAPVRWVDVVVGGTTYKLPLYQ